jgi:NNP family nitrate/nitrite transporter-like MFS transporter
LTMVYSVLTALARVPGGILSDKVGGELALVLAFSMVFLGSVMMIFAQDIPWALAGAVMMALGMGVANAGVFKLVPKYLPQAVGGGAGLVGGLGAFGGFAIPPVMGFFVQQYGQQGYSSGFLVFFLLSLLCLSISWWLLLTAPKEPVVCQEIFTTDLRSEDRPAGQEQRVDTGSMPL